MNLKELIKTNTATFLDVREPIELETEGEVPNAVLIPMREIPKRLEEIQSFSTPLIIFCRSGIRSKYVVDYLKELGFSNLYNGGGFKEINTVLEE